MSSLVGVTLKDRYFLRELIGSGGMADVYLTWDKLRSVRLAVKVLRRDLCRSTRFLQQFAKEAEILNKLEHPNIVRLYEFEKDGDAAFIVMDWVEGTNLRQAIQNAKQPLPLADVSRILAAVCAALNFAHQSKIYHCDIKPGNVMLHVDGRVLLTDFGVAHLADEEGVGGTPPYMAPEQFMGGAIDSRTDVYALGITLYEILSGGKIPYRGESANSQGSTTRERIAWEIINLPMPSLREQNPTISKELELVVTTAIQKDLTLRFPNTLAMDEAFEKAVTNLGGEKKDLLKTTFLNPSNHGQRETPAVQNLSLPPEKDPQRPKNSTSPVQTPARSPSMPPPAPKRGKGPALYCRSGPWAGQMLAIVPGEMVIGRGSQCHLNIGESSVSRRHATILITRRGTYIRDDGSSLGTFVNGARINGPVLLHDRDVIQIGYQCVFEYRS